MFSDVRGIPPSGSKRPIPDIALKDSRTVRSAMLISGQVAAIGVMLWAPYTFDMTATETSLRRRERVNRKRISRSKLKWGR